MKARGGRAVGWMLVGCVPVASAGVPAAIPPATAIVAVEAAAGPDAVTVTIRADGTLSPGRIRRIEHFRPRLVIDFPGLAAAAVPGTPVGMGPVDRVRVDRRSVGLTRVVLELSRAARHRIEHAGPGARSLSVVFPRETPGAPSFGGARAGPFRRPLPSGPAPPASTAVSGPTGPAGSGRGEPAGLAAPTAGHAAAPGAGRSGGSAVSAPVRFSGQAARDGRRYTGDPVSMDFQNADLRAVLRVFADISDLNLVIDPSVQGEVNVALTEVPWDQAFDVILRAAGLGHEIEGTVVRIASAERLQQEAEARAVLARREAEAGDLVVFTRTLSHARADDLASLLTGTLLSPRGEVFTDVRTNTLIVRDLEDRVAAFDDLLLTLDRVEPQVEIEARIVRAGRDSARALGVQWGLGGRLAANRGEAGRGAAANGSAGSGQRLGTGVDLGVGAPTSRLGVALGRADGPLVLDVVLSALESRGELQIISSPRVTTQNNVAAEILQGDQIPYQTVANNTVTVQFKEAALTLRVTPQITAVDTVVMQVEVENSFADFARALGTPPIPAVVTQRAATTVQVGDGETAVIGGIYENTRSEQNSRTPGLHRIPLLGRLFRSSARNESADELMIFITPRIVRP